jgi:hypothetical protein
VAADVALGVLVDPRLPVLAGGDDDGALHGTDGGVVRLDAAVEDADARAGAARLAVRPVARDLLRPGALDRDL